MASPFSLLLPVYRGDQPDHFRTAFASSVAEQTLPPDEVVIVRDGEVPEELEQLLVETEREADLPIRIVRLADNQGLARALEVGLEMCAHEVVARMDADDLSLPERFEKQMAAIDGGLDLVGTGMLEFHGDLSTVVGRRVPRTGAAIGPYSRFHDPFNHPTVVYRRAAVRAAGGYKPMGLMEDYWLFARMIQTGARTDNIPEPLVGYRVDEGAYQRRGGLGQLRAELRLQREFRRGGFTSPGQAARNVLVRGGYRLVPEGIRRAAYRRLIAEGGA